MQDHTLQYTTVRKALIAILSMIILTSVSIMGQAPVASTTLFREFGWSLRPDNKSRKKKAPKNERPLQDRVTPESDVIRVETDLVISDVLIVDKDGNHVKGLTKQDLIVSEN